MPVEIGTARAQFAVSVAFLFTSSLFPHWDRFTCTYLGPRAGASRSSTGWNRRFSRDSTSNTQGVNSLCSENSVA
jgi:hypothetical protein